MNTNNYFTTAPISISHEEKTILSVFDVSTLIHEDIKSKVSSSTSSSQLRQEHSEYSDRSEDIHDLDDIKALASVSAEFDPVLALMQLSRDVRFPSAAPGSAIMPQVGDELPSHVVGSPSRINNRRHALNARKRSSSVAFFESQSDSGSEDKKRKFKCTIDGCDKGFPSRAHLERHQRGVHFKYKPFKCPHPVCGKSFSRHDNMLQHYRSHKK